MTCVHTTRLSQRCEAHLILNSLRAIEERAARRVHSIRVQAACARRATARLTGPGQNDSVQSVDLDRLTPESKQRPLTHDQFDRHNLPLRFCPAHHEAPAGPPPQQCRDGGPHAITVLHSVSWAPRNTQPAARSAGTRRVTLPGKGPFWTTFSENSRPFRARFIGQLMRVLAIS